MRFFGGIRALKSMLARLENYVHVQGSEHAERRLEKTISFHF